MYKKSTDPLGKPVLAGTDYLEKTIHIAATIHRPVKRTAQDFFSGIIKKFKKLKNFLTKKSA